MIARPEEKERVLYEFDVFRVDPVRRLLLRAEEPVAITPKAFSILLALLEHPGEVVEKAELIERVWPGRLRHRGEPDAEHLLPAQVPGRAGERQPLHRHHPRPGVLVRRRAAADRALRHLRDPDRGGPPGAGAATPTPADAPARPRSADPRAVPSARAGGALRSPVPPAPDRRPGVCGGCSSGPAWGWWRCW